MVMDVRDMSAFDTRSFAAVIDKGSVIAIICVSQNKTMCVLCSIF